MSSLVTLGILSVWLLQLGAMGAASTGTSINNSAPKTTAQVLQEHHVGLTKKDLVAALQNSDAEVRGLAAIELAYDYPTEALANVTQALSAETVPTTRADMALALIQLGSTTGRIVLKQQCAQGDAPGYLRITAARYLLDSNDNACMGEVISLLESTRDPDERQQALELLPQFREVSIQLASRRRRTVAASLNDSTPSVRIAAVDALAHLGDESSRAALRGRLAREPDEEVRSEIKDSLRRLEKKSSDRSQ